MEIEYVYHTTNEIEIPDLQSVNKYLISDDLIIVTINIRGMKTNFEKLELMIDTLQTKPDVVICTETGRLPCFQYFKLDGYKNYYNHGNINKSDGVMIYIRINLSEYTIVEEIGNFKYLSTTLKLKNNQEIKISSIYRCFDLNKNLFIDAIKSILTKNKRIKNHCIAGDFNMNILKNDLLTNDYLNSLLELDMHLLSKALLDQI